MSNDKETCKGQPVTREERIAQTQQWLGATHVPRVGEPVVKQEVMMILVSCWTGSSLTVFYEPQDSTS
jgi:hypothetical protein